jgi:hypothetical protein
MVSEVVLVFISAIAGGLITIFVTYFNNKARRFELEYNYRKKVEESYLFNAQKHLNDVYIPLYTRLIYFQNSWIRIKNSSNYENLENEIDDIKKFKNSLEDQGLTAFLTTEIEDSFDHLLDFLSKSLDASKIRYGINEQYYIFGQEKSLYRVLPEWYGHKRIFFYKIIVPFLNLFRYINWVNITGLVDYKLKIIVDSAPISSNDFDAQLIKFSRNLNEKIKEITLGTK